MAEEYQALIDNGTWRLIPRPHNANVVTTKCLFKNKYHFDGTLARHNVDYDETFSLAVKSTMIQAVLSIVTSCSWPIHQLYMKSVFLHGHLEETVYC